MSYILNIETATKNCSVSLSENGVLLKLIEIAEENYSHAEQLHIFIEKALQQANITFKDLDAVAISKGPGSYTGLRIGVSAAKGLCFALNIPLISIDTILILAKQITDGNKIIIPVIDARRLEIYCSVFSSNFDIIQPIEAHILNENSFSEIQKSIIFIGDCVQKCQDILKIENATYIHSFPSAKEMSSFSFEKFLNKDFEDVAYFEPFYLKDFILNK
jgi:tRNA threonylcarbamoyladenosine biosynthesis protein TsaB